MKTALKDAISDAYDTAAGDAAMARFDQVMSLIEAAYVDRTTISADYTADDFASQRAAMLDALQVAWAALPATPTEAQQMAALKSAIAGNYTADPIDPDPGDPDIPGLISTRTPPSSP